jgi:hypothetical protein
MEKGEALSWSGISTDESKRDDGQAQQLKSVILAT